ncbi:hypothetical protein F3F96_07445 [Mariprofundus sp. NF]|uniref:hypothetical protein n=1 Tax=Mariprofundus sp. NF TaxID=2608716 RepID=UPI0015A16B44|nr:hypothetical protein [Mariprofundus sp. NF]NWF38964.1 hypothetical protein [Mariprofundus sp. NF]
MRIKDSSVELYSRHKSSRRMGREQSWPLAVDEPHEGDHDQLDISVEARQVQHETAEQLPLFANESAFLALDRGSNGRVSGRTAQCSSTVYLNSSDPHGLIEQIDLLS